MFLSRVGFGDLEGGNGAWVIAFGRAGWFWVYAVMFTVRAACCTIRLLNVADILGIEAKVFQQGLGHRLMNYGRSNMNKIGIYYAYWTHEWDADFHPFVDKVADLGFDVLEVNSGTVAT